MREYGRIETQFWTNVKVMRLSDKGKLLMAYLLTGPHTNNIGCFRLPSGYIEADMGWDSQTVTQTLSELLGEGFIDRCAKTGWTWIVSFLKHNPIENPNVGKAAISYINAVPRTLDFYGRLLEKLKPYAERFPKDYLKDIGGKSTDFTAYQTEEAEPFQKGFAEGSDNGRPNGIGNIEPDPEPNPDPDPKPDSVVIDPDLLPMESEEVDVQAAMKVWNDLVKDLGLSQVQKLTRNRRVRLKARLKDTGGIGGWAGVLVKIRDSAFLRGENKNGWRANFDFVLQESSFNKLREGAYNDREKFVETPVPKGLTNEPANVTVYVPPSLDAIPPEILSKLEKAFTTHEIKQWFGKAIFLEEGKRIQVSSPFQRDWIENNFETRLRMAFKEIPVIEVLS